MWWTFLALALALAAKPAAADPSSELVCPSGASPVGARPPVGRGVWCERPVPGGAVREGPAELYDEAGALQARGGYADGREHGLWTYYRADGGVARVGQMVLGQRFGQWRAFWPNGHTESQGEYLDDQRHGRWELFSEDGVRRQVGEYLRGAEVGVWTEYGIGDRPLRERVYRDGRLITVRDL